MGFFSRSTPEIGNLQEALDAQARRVRDLLDRVRLLEDEIHKLLKGLGERLDEQERRTRLMVEEMDERIDRGNKIWRKIRSHEYYAQQREDGDEDEDANLEFHFGNGEGGPPEELPAVHPGMGWPRRTPSKAQEVGKALARRLAGLE